MEIESHHHLNGFHESIGWTSTLDTDHKRFHGSGVTRLASEIDVLSKAAAEDNEARFELRERLRQADEAEREAKHGDRE